MQSAEASDAGADVRHAGQLEQALHRAVLAEGPVQHREDDVDAGERGRDAAVGQRESDGASVAVRRPRAVPTGAPGVTPRAERPARRRGRSRRARPRSRSGRAPRPPRAPRPARSRARSSGRREHRDAQPRGRLTGRPAGSAWSGCPSSSCRSVVVVAVVVGGGDVAADQIVTVAPGLRARRRPAGSGRARARPGSGRSRAGCSTFDLEAGVRQRRRRRRLVQAGHVGDERRRRALRDGQRHRRARRLLGVRRAGSWATHGALRLVESTSLRADLEPCAESSARGLVVRPPDDARHGRPA